MATIDNNLLLTENAFSKCAPNISTNLRQCGSVALCNAKPLTSGDLESVYAKSGEYRVMEHLLKSQMEIKSCEAKQNGLYDFLMANKVNISGKRVPIGGSSALVRIAPFINARQFSPINNEYWLFTTGNASGENWEVSVTSAGNVPLDARSFPIGINVFLNSAGSGGAASRTAWKVVTSTLNGAVIDLVLSPQNSESNLDASKLDSTPTTGYLTRGNNNVDDFEKECQEKPAYNTKKLVQFWLKTRRWSMCKSSAYDEWRTLMLSNNPLFREFGDVPDVERNRQLAMEFQKAEVQDFFWAKPLENQNVATYDQLDDIDSFDATEGDTITPALGVDGGICIGKRAEPVGVYEQLAECDRVVDLLGEQLNLIALFKAFYHIIRIRNARGDNNKQIDVFTDTTTAEWINRAMIKYYSARAEDHNGDAILRINVDAGPFGVQKQAEFGFLYRSYNLHWPAGVVFNVLTHYAFDDEITVAEDAGIGDTARRLWVLNFANIYPGIIASNRIVQNTGDLKALASVHADFACVMKVHTRQQTLMSVSGTTVVECPAENLIIENFQGGLPDHTEIAGLTYGAVTTTTTTPA